MGKKSRNKSLRKRIIPLYEKLAPSILLDHFSPDCCINGTRVAIEVLSHFGIKARPLTTEVIIFNKIYWDKLTERGDFPGPAELERWWRDGAWSLGCMGGKGDGPGWGYHLVAVAQGHVIDSASGQYRRPEKAIDMPDDGVPHVRRVPFRRRGGSRRVLGRCYGELQSSTRHSRIRDYLGVPAKSPESLGRGKNRHFHQEIARCLVCSECSVVV